MRTKQEQVAPTIREFEADMIEGEYYPEDYFDLDDYCLLPCESISLALQEIYLEEHIATNWPSRLGDVL